LISSDERQVMDNVKLYNYAADAIDSLQQFAANVESRGDTGSAAATRRLVELLRKGEKFLLPNCAEIVDTASLGEAHLELLRLPYPVTVFEAQWEKDDPVTPYVNGMPQMRSSRRIALCWELGDRPGPFPDEEARMREAYPEGGTFVASIYYIDHFGAWHPAAGMVFVPRDFRIAPDAPALPGSVQAELAMSEAGQDMAHGYRFHAEPIPIAEGLFAEAVARFNGDRATALSQILVDTRDELQMMVQACAVLNCANVKTVDVRPSPTAMAMRAAKKKAPLFSYKVLQLAPDAGSDDKHGAGRGTHASPRTHLRRGHIRRLPDRTLWISATLVNRGSANGAVSKDYQILPRQGG
jgi:hypothetical protein